MGQFTQEDPIGLGGGMNAYGFAPGDRVNFSDPLGLCKDSQGIERGSDFCPGGQGIRSAGAADPLFVLAGGLFALGRGALAAAADQSAGDAFFGLTKGAAKDAAASMGLAAAQEAGVRSAIGRATSSSTIDLFKAAADNVYVQVSRPGRDGFQVMQSIVSPSGAKSVTQVIIDGAGKVFLDPKRAIR